MVLGASGMLDIISITADTRCLANFDVLVCVDSTADRLQATIIWAINAACMHQPSVQMCASCMTFAPHTSNTEPAK
jgi:hypothetical protein